MLDSLFHVSLGILKALGIIALAYLALCGVVALVVTCVEVII